MNLKTLKAKCARALVVYHTIEKLTEERKALYKEHDELALELRKESNLEAHGLRLRSPFEKGNTVFGHGPVRALILEPVDKKKASEKKS